MRTHSYVVVVTLSVLHEASIAAISFSMLPHAYTSECLSPNGQVVGGTNSDATNPGAGLWSAALGLQVFATPNAGSIRGLSFDGSIGGGVQGTPQGQRAARWQSGVATQLGVLPSGNFSRADDISYDGQVIVGISRFGPTTRVQAFRWTATGGMEGLGVPAGSDQSFANATNFDGTVLVGHTALSGVTQTAYRWTAETGFVSIGRLSTVGGSIALDVSAAGDTIAGNSLTPDGNRAFLWRSETGMANLGTAGLDFVSSQANAISGNGAVVIGNSFNATTSRSSAMMWTAELGMVDLNQYLPSLGLNLGEWRLFDARDISEDGRTIVGIAQRDTIQQYWIATIPAPSTLLAVGASIISALRRRR